MKHWILASVIALLAAIRFLYRISSGLLLFAALLAAMAACLQHMGVFRTPYVGEYLSKLPIEASVTLLGILLASMSALRMWRLQKRDELLLQSLFEIRAFFELAMATTQTLTSYVPMLSALQSELKSGPYNLKTYWHARYLHEQVGVMRDAQARLGRLAVEVHTLDSRNVHAMTANLLAFLNFKKAKKYLVEISALLPFYIPKTGEDDTDGFIFLLRQAPDQEYAAFLAKADGLNIKMAAALGGIQGNVQAKYFPPTFTLAWASLRSKNDD